jgi:hypothetical protein
MSGNHGNPGYRGLYAKVREKEGLDLMKKRVDLSSCSAKKGLLHRGHSDQKEAKFTVFRRFSTPQTGPQKRVPKKVVFAKMRHFGQTFGHLVPKSDSRFRPPKKRSSVEGSMGWSSSRFLGTPLGGPRTARGHFAARPRHQWSIGAPRFGHISGSPGPLDLTPKSDKLARF